jgi:hypothetical protein
MKKTSFLALLLLCASLTSWAQRNVGAAAATARTETRALPDFTSIDVTDGIELIIQPGPTTGAVVDASTAQFRRMLKTVVEGAVLRVYFDYQHEPNWQGLVHSREVFKVVVTTRELRALTATNGAAITLASGLQPGAPGVLTVQLRAGASLAGAVQVPQLTMQLRGGSSARLTGTATTLQLRVTEGSDFRSPQLRSDACTAFAASASTVRFAVHRNLEASAVNEATITYSGPAQLTREHHEQGGQIMHF